MSDLSSKFKFLPLMMCIVLSVMTDAGCLGHNPDGPPGPGGSSVGNQAAPSAKGVSEPAESVADLDESGPSDAENHETWLTGCDLETCLPDIRKEAETAGFAASLTCPDEEDGGHFLCVAQDQASAEVLNGFFYWFSGQPNGDPLVLGLDRLFPESGRQTAIAGGQFSDPAIVGLLAGSLRKILGNNDQPGILDFILSCYRDDFSRRLNSQEQPEEKSWQKKFDNLEVIYHASVFSTVVFRIPEK
jgi:hypothetical protein